MPRHATPASFKKGQSGNKMGRPVIGQSLAEMMRAYLEQPHATAEGKTNKQVFIEKVYAKAAGPNPDIAAMKLTWNYVDGLPKDNSDGGLIGAMLDKATFVISPPEQKKKDE